MLVEQSNYRVGTPKYVETGYKLALAKNRKSIANRAVNNVKSQTKLGKLISYLKEYHKEIDLANIYKSFDKSEV